MFSDLKKHLLCASVLGGLAVGAAPAVAAPSAPATIEAGRPVQFNVMLPLRNREQLEDFVADLHNPNSPNFHHWVTPAQFAERFGPDKAAVSRIATALRARGFAVEEHMRSLHVTGAADLVGRTFATTLAARITPAGHTLVAATTPLRVPAEIAAEHADVVGLEGLERRPMSHRVTGALPDGAPDNRYGNVGHYYYDDLKQAYVYPAHNSTVTPKGGTAKPFDGTGVTIGALMSSDVLDSDVQLIFDHENFSKTTGTADPTLFLRRPVNGGTPFSTSSNGSFEASLDVQAELTGAPGAHVVLYNIPSLSDSNIIDGYTAILQDNLVDVVSSSFGGCEADYLPKYNNGIDGTLTLKYEHELYLQGNAAGITFLASSGDQAGKICPSYSYYPKGKNGVFQAGASSPATDPAVTGVGGTNLVTVYDVGTLNSTYAGENAWSDARLPYDPYGLGTTVRGGVWGAGGGASVIFAAPKYQSRAATGSTMRMTPDIGMQVGGCPGGAADFDPKIGKCNGGNSAVNGSGNTDRSYYIVGFGGVRYGVIGTSVSSPELASAVALLVEQNGRMGNLNPYIYDLSARQANGGRRVFHTNIPGYNGLIQSNISSTYNVSTGVGTPIVREFLGTKAPAAGTPQTPSNP